MYHVKKRNGEIADFDIEKIRSAITKTFSACNREYQESIIEMIVIKSIANAEKKIKDSVLDVEDIQDSVEATLMNFGYEDVAKAYILYRKQHEKSRKAMNTVLDYKKTIEGYVDAIDWRVKENASIDYSLGGLILGNSGAVTANYWLSEIYDKEIADAHRNCDIHLHDLSMLSGYCFTGDTKVAVIKKEYEAKYIDDPYIQNADGRINYREFVSFEELIKSNRKNPYIIAHTGNVDDDQFEVIQAEDIRITRYVDTVIEITFKTLCYGDIKIKSTLDHPYMVFIENSDGDCSYDFVKASELKIGDYVNSLEFDLGGGYVDCGQQVKDINIVKLDKEIPVYDLTVPKYHNFVIEGDIFVHNCAGWSLKTLIKEGFGGVPKKISSAPAKHLSTICNQMINFLGTMSLEWAGAQAFNSVDTLLAPFIKVDDMPYSEVKQCIQSLVFGLNVSSRWGSQPVFSNFTFDWTVPDDLAELNCIVGGKELDFKYKDCQREIDMINRAFLETMIAGDSEGRSFAYPIPTYSITKDFDWSDDSTNNKLLFELTAKYGVPYFSNYINSDIKASDVRSMAILGTQDIIYKDKYGRVSKLAISKLVTQWIKNPDTKYSILMNGRFVEVIDMFEVPYESYNTYIRVNLKNGQHQNFSYDHKCIVVRDGNLIEVLAQDIKGGDSFILARHGYDESDIGTYEAGKIVGYYLAEGWKSHNGAEIDFAINIERSDICDDISKFFKESFGCRVSIDELQDKHCYKVKVFGRDACAFVSKFILGDRANEKRISTTCFDTRLAFRNGIYDGYLNTDGSTKSNIFAHTTNKNLCSDMIQLFATTGKYFKYQENRNNTRYFKADKSDLVHFSSYKLRPYKPEIFNEDYYLIPIDSIESIDASRTKTVYNFTVNTDEHLYELPNGIITHQCCRLRLDLRELRHKNGGYFGSGDNTGSIQVCTINMPRIAYTSSTETEFYSKLEHLMGVCARAMDIKRHVLTQYLENGLYPYTKRYLGSFDDHFSTIGIVGMNECCLNAKWVHDSIASDCGREFALNVLDFMRNKLSDYQEQYGCLFNLEATPAESTTHRFAKHDKERYPDIITAGDKTDGAPYYTNSSHLPVGYTDDIFEALEHQDDLQTKYTSGTVFHAFLGEKLPDWKSAMNLTRKIAENYKLPYFTFSPTYSICPDHGYITGEHWECPKCGKATEVYSRVTGYYRAVQNFNDGKAHEFRDRKEYKIKQSDISTDLPETEKKDEVIEDNQEIIITKPTLFTSSTCPNCRMAKQKLEEAGIDFDVVVADINPDLAIQFNIKQAPTLLLASGERVESVSNIIKYIRTTVTV